MCVNELQQSSQRIVIVNIATTLVSLHSIECVPGANNPQKKSKKIH